MSNSETNEQHESTIQAIRATRNCSSTQFEVISRTSECKSTEYLFLWISNLLGTTDGTTHSGYGTTPVWCRGGSRYIEGARDFLIKKRHLWTSISYFACFMSISICLFLHCQFPACMFLLCSFLNCFSTNGASGAIFNILGTHIYTNNIFLKRFHLFSDIVWTVFVINKGPGSRYLVTCLEVPKMFQKVLQYVRESTWSVLE